MTVKYQHCCVTVKNYVLIKLKLLHYLRLSNAADVNCLEYGSTDQSLEFYVRIALLYAVHEYSFVVYRI